MVTHCSIAWKISWTEEPGRQRVGHDLVIKQQQHHIYVYILFQNLFPYRLSKILNIVLCRSLLVIYYIYIVACMC